MQERGIVRLGRGQEKGVDGEVRVTGLVGDGSGNGEKVRWKRGGGELCVGERERAGGCMLALGGVRSRVRRCVCL